MHAVDVAQPDVCCLGGLTRTLRVAAMARAGGLACTPHAANLSLVTVFTLHLMGAIEGAGPYVEFTIEGSEYTRGRTGSSSRRWLPVMARSGFRTGPAGAWRST